MSFRTFDAETIRTVGTYLVGELERLDPKIYEPLVSYTWSRDIDLRTDVTIADETSSYIIESASVTGTPNPGGKQWIGADSTAIAGVTLSGEKISQPMHPWAMALEYDIISLAKAQQTGRPLEERKHKAITLKYQMDMDEQVYKGDKPLDIDGISNHRRVVTENSAMAWTPTTDKKRIVALINGLLLRVYKDTGDTLCPDRLLMPTGMYTYLATTQLTDYQDKPLLDYLLDHCLSTKINGEKPIVAPCKHLDNVGVGGRDRLVVYRKGEDYLRLPATTMQRTPPQYVDLNMRSILYCAIGGVELIHPETMRYLDLPQVAMWIDQEDGNDG